MDKCSKGGEQLTESGRNFAHQVQKTKPNIFTLRKFNCLNFVLDPLRYVVAAGGRPRPRVNDEKTKIDALTSALKY